MRSTPNWPGWREPDRSVPFEIPRALKQRATSGLAAHAHHSTAGAPDDVADAVERGEADTPE